jgi:integron integrase
MEQRPKKFLDTVRDILRRRHYAHSTADSYVHWIKRFILYHDKRHPNEMGGAEVEQFLTHLATVEKVAPSTQNQAFSALLFLYREVLDQDFQAPLKNVRAREQRDRLPNVLTKDEVKRLLAKMSGTSLLMARLLYGSGLRVLELCTLRVKDVDFEQHLIRVHDSKGDKDRVTVLPDSLLAPLKEHLSHVQQLHEKDLAKGHGAVAWPYALDRKYPNADKEWGWQYAFPSAILSHDKQDGTIRRFHTSPATIQKAVKEAARLAGFSKPVGPHTLTPTS